MLHRGCPNGQPLLRWYPKCKNQVSSLTKTVHFASIYITDIRQMPHIFLLGGVSPRRLQEETEYTGAFTGRDEFYVQGE